MAVGGPMTGPYPPPPPYGPGQPPPGAWVPSPWAPGGPGSAPPAAGGWSPGAPTNQNHESPTGSQPAGWSAPGSEPGAGSGRGAFRRPTTRRAPSAAGAVPLRPLNVSEILDGAFVTMRTNPGATLGLTLVVGAVFEIVGALVTLAAKDASFAFYTVLQIVLRGLDLTLVILLAGVLAVVVAEASLDGRPRITLADTVRRAGPRLPGLAGLAVLLTLLMVLGLATLGVVSVWLGVLFCFATPVYALEGGTVTAALRRSRYLIRGAWWRTFGILLLAGVIAGTLVLVVSVPVLLFTAPSSGGSSGDPSAVSLILQALGSLLIVTIVTPVLAGVIAVLYIDRRIRREALDVTLARAAASGATDVVAAAAAPPTFAIPAPGRPPHLPSPAPPPAPMPAPPPGPVPGAPPGMPGPGRWPQQGGWS